MSYPTVTSYQQDDEVEATRVYTIRVSEKQAAILYKLVGTAPATVEGKALYDQLKQELLSNGQKI